MWKSCTTITSFTASFAVASLLTSLALVTLIAKRLFGGEPRIAALAAIEAPSDDGIGSEAA